MTTSPVTVKAVTKDTLISADFTGNMDAASFWIIVNTSMNDLKTYLKMKIRNK